VTNQNPAPGRVDLYIEKIAAYMNLDDAQRQDVVKELHNHLDEAIDQGVRDGMAREYAETVAMERFGDPTMLAGKFGTLQGKAWVLLEAAAYALLMFAVFQWQLRKISNRPESITSTHLAVAAVVFSLIALTARLWNRVQVNGSLRIYRFLRRTQIIPFDSISNVSLDRFHLGGSRTIYIDHGSGQKATYSMSWPNARCVGIALEVLAPDTIQPRAAAFFRKLRLRAGTESVSVKIWLTLGWIILAAGLATTFELLWSGEGMSLVYGLCLSGSALWLGLQYYLDGNRAKRAILLVLQTAFIVLVLPWNIYPLVSTADTRPLFILLAVFMPLPVLLLWWRTRNRMALVAISAAWVAIAYTSAKSVPGSVSVGSQSLGTVEGYITDATWLGRAQVNHPTLAALGYRTLASHSTEPLKPILTLTSDGETTDKLLPTGMWSIVAGGTDSTATVLTQTVGKLGPGALSDDDHEFYEINENGELTNLGRLDDTSPFMTGRTPDVAVSPDGRYFLLSAVDTVGTGTETKRYRPAIFDRETKQLLKLDNERTARPWRWSTTSTLEMLVSDYTEGDKKEHRTYEVWQLNAVTGEFTGTGKTFRMKADEYISSEISRRFAVINGEATFAITNLETGTSISLPLPNESDARPAWNSKLSRVCYLSEDRNIILAGPEGIIATLPLKRNQKIGILRIAPDGTKVFYATQRIASLMFPIGQLYVWDVSRKQNVKVGRASMVATLLAFIHYEGWGSYLPIQWTADSRSVIWNSYDFGFNRRSLIATEFRSLDYEEWAENRAGH